MEADVLVSSKSQAHYPALIVGLGGTGVRTLRFLRWLIESGDDGDLKAMLLDGRLSLFGIDTESGSASAGAAVAHSVIPPPQRHGDPREDREILPALDHYVVVERTAIEDTYETLREQVFRKQERGEAEPEVPFEHQCILNWFPWPKPGEPAAMSVGQTTSEGASQWRPLGRIGLFSETEKIHQGLRGLLERVSLVSERLGQLPRVFIVSSLAGGTGSGMFWDVAFILRLINRRAFIRGYFLLPDVFEGVDRAGRIWSNAYAALKEIAVYKNWRQDSESRIRVTYPLRNPNNVYTAYPGSRPAYNSVFLYKAFLPDNTGRLSSEAITPESARSYAVNVIDKTCLEVARNAVCHLRVDVHKELGVGGNNEAADDADNLRDQKEGGYVFCTSAVVAIDTGSLQRCRDRLQRYALDALYQQVDPDSEKALEAKEIGLIQEFFIDFLDNRKPEDILKDSLAASGPSRLRQYMETLSEVRAELSDPPQNSSNGAHTKFRKVNVAELYERAIPESVREGWLKSLSTDGEPAPPQARLAYIDELYEVDSFIDYELERLTETADKFKDNPWRLLHPDDERRLGALLKLFENTANGKDRPFVEVEAPPDYQLGRVFFGAINENEKKRLMALRERHGDDRAVEYLERLLKEFLTTLETVQRGLEANAAEPGTVLELPGIEDPKEAVLARVIESRQRFVGRTQSIRAAADWNRDRRFDFARTLGIEMARFPRLNGQAELENLLAPLTRKIRELEERPGIRASEEIARHLASVMMMDDDFKDHAGERYSSEEDLEKELRGPLAELCKDALNPAKTAHQAFLAAMLNIYPLKIEEVKDHESFARYLRISEIFRKHFIEYWLDQRDFFIARLEGETGAGHLFSAFRAKVFRVGAVDNIIKHENLLVMPPQSSASLPSDLADKNRDLIVQELVRRAHAELLVTDSVSSESSPRPIIYYESLYRAPQELASIHQYYEAYRQEKEGHRVYFHVLPGAVDLPDIFTTTEPPRAILCGNPGCEKDLRGTERTVLICPGCGEPIRNRCGNAECRENALSQRIEDVRLDRGLADNEPIYDCPECQKPMWTYWWRCEDAKHRGQQISTDTRGCPACLKEVQDGIRSEDDVSVFGPREMIVCPGCRRIGNGQDRVLSYPAILKPYYRDGVSSAQARGFKNLVKAHGLPPHRCRNGETVHYLFPTCPRGREEDTHHLTRLNGKFACEQHPRLSFASCHACGYPIEVNDDVLDSQQALTCERCMRNVVACHFCFAATPALVEPRSGEQSGYEACPNCRNPIKPLATPVETAQLDSAIWHTDTPAFCRNMFGCRAGRDPYRAITDYDTGGGICQACDVEESPLLHYVDLERFVARCPLCLILLGTLEKGSVVTLDRDSALEKIREDVEKTQSWGPRLDDYCPLCGSHRRAVYDWMRDGGGTVPESTESTDKRAKNDEEALQTADNGSDIRNAGFSFDDFLELTQNMVRIEDDRALYHELHRKGIIDSLDAFFTGETKGILGSIFKYETVCERAFMRRFDRLIELNNERTVRRQG